MSDAPAPEAQPLSPEAPPTVLPVPPDVLPVRVRQPHPRRAASSALGTAIKWLVILAVPVFFAFGFGLILGFMFGGALGGVDFNADANSPVREKFHSGTKSATDRIAILKVEGVIVEGMIRYPLDQIDEAVSDDKVKAVVLRINSPGGSITASDELHRRLLELRRGLRLRKSGTTNGLPKPVVVSMGSLAASGGYYIAMLDGGPVFAEPATITGSIGVYAAFPNVAKLADTYGVRMEIIKAGDVKDSGSMFHEMSPQERYLWQDMVNHAYDQFLAVIENGRPKLGNFWFSNPMTEELADETRFLPLAERKDRPDEKGKRGEKDPKGEKEKGEKTDKPESVKYVRRRADGGIFTADKAKKYGLIDQIGYLEDAIQAAKEQGRITGEFQVVTYERASSLSRLLGLDVSEAAPPVRPDLKQFMNGTTPRLWYLLPQAELSGILGASTGG